MGLVDVIKTRNKTSKQLICSCNNYLEKEFHKYSKFISCFLVGEQNNELLIKNHKTHPIGYAPFTLRKSSIRDQFLNQKVVSHCSDQFKYQFTK